MKCNECIKSRLALAPWLPIGKLFTGSDNGLFVFHAFECDISVTHTHFQPGTDDGSARTPAGRTSKRICITRDAVCTTNESETIGITL